MLELDLEPRPRLDEPRLDGAVVHVQEEPALEIALPQVFEQPPLIALRRRKLPYIGALVARIHRTHQANPDGVLGPDYQVLVNEFQPLFAWAMSCWDFLLSREGCRFVPRQREFRVGIRGDYRVVTSKDFSRLIHGVFRRCVLAFAQDPDAPSLTDWLRQRFWPGVLGAYRHLEDPPDPRQRTLTPYSYLRCVPYRFLNAFHHGLVYSTVWRLPPLERGTLEAYFLHFYTEAACAETLRRSIEECGTILRTGLIALLLRERLVYCLLRQIERY